MERAKALSLAHTDIRVNSPANARRALLQLHRLFTEAPHAIFTQYEQLSEDILVRDGDEAADRLMSGDYSWAAPARASERAWAATVGAQLRALDWTLLALAPDTADLSDVSRWFVAEFDCFVIPRKSGRKPMKQGYGFEKRGLLKHRVVPRLARGHEIRLVPNDMLSGSQDRNKSVVLGAALFENLKLETRQSRTGKDRMFTAVGIDCPSAGDAVVDHLDTSLDDKCFGVVWPELTITPQLRTTIQKTLAARSLQDDHRSPVQVVVAGSWHEPDVGTFVNRATVFDGYGGLLTTYEKTIPYIDPELGPEDIKPGRILPIVVTDELLVGFAICKDFCDVSVSKSPYFEVDIDLLLVPSMGGAATMQGHQNSAKRIQAMFGTRTFVVQQVDPDLTSTFGCGIVLPAMPNPSSKSVRQLKQKNEWKVYKVAK